MIMDFAIITERYPEGLVKTMRSTVQPPPREMTIGAERLDSFLHERTLRLEAKLIGEHLLDEIIPVTGSQKPRGNSTLWYAVGKELATIAKERGITGPRERRWLWEAIDNLHATERLKRAGRGRTRVHFEYCYRLSQFPQRVAERMNWSEWVYFFDSLTVRDEPRSDKWLRQKINRPQEIDRRIFRRFTENLNRRIRAMDTSVLSDAELFRLYDGVWDSTEQDVKGRV